MNLAQLRALAVSVGFPDPDTAAAIAMAESGGDPCANGDPRNPSDCNNDYDSTSFGLWQVHVPAHPQYNSTSLKTATYNAQAALAISNGGTNFHPWSTFNVSPDGSPPKYLQYMPAGSPAVASTSKVTSILNVLLAIGATSVVLSEIIRHGGIGPAWHAAGRSIRRYV